VGHVVAAMLNVLELANAVVDIFEVFEGLLEQAGAVTQIAGNFGKHVEKLGVPGNKTDHAGGTLLLIVLTDRESQQRNIARSG
jgi:hypothetical protein